MHTALEASVRLSTVALVLLNHLLLLGCSPKEGAPVVGSKSAVESIHTDLGAESCAKEIDKTDPNETPYRVCPGVAGYKLIVRNVEETDDIYDIRVRRNKQRLRIHKQRLGIHQPEEHENLVILHADIRKP